MTVIVTSDVPARFRGFLASCALEITAGVYTSPRMSPAVRDRVWTVLEDWWNEERRGSVLMTWHQPSARGGQGLKMIGIPVKEFADIDGLTVVKKIHPSLVGIPLPSVEAAVDAAPGPEEQDGVIRIRFREQTPQGGENSNDDSSD